MTTAYVDKNRENSASEDSGESDRRNHNGSRYSESYAKPAVVHAICRGHAPKKTGGARANGGHTTATTRRGKRRSTVRRESDASDSASSSGSDRSSGAYSSGSEVLTPRQRTYVTAQRSTSSAAKASVSAYKACGDGGSTRRRAARLNTGARVTTGSGGWRVKVGKRCYSSLAVVAGEDYVGAAVVRSPDAVNSRNVKERFQGAFYVEGGSIMATGRAMHHIDLDSHRPVYMRRSRYTEAQRLRRKLTDAETRYPAIERGLLGVGGVQQFRPYQGQAFQGKAHKPLVWLDKMATFMQDGTTYYVYA
ncbi:hypothetical protein AAG570_013239 [Ranatra chinensis]|uniref:Uncharacterized protein n=1 Tax=Ranatra chinensis TaxID=642074 RepID=A0ABD0YG60_9HEMI